MRKYPIDRVRLGSLLIFLQLILSSATAIAASSFVTEVRTSKGSLKIRLHTDTDDFIAKDGNQYDEDYVENIVKILNFYGPKLVDYFDYLPKNEVQFVVNHLSRQANGSATVFPREQIELYPFPPLHNHYLRGGEEHTTTLVVHELTHILHLDQTRGFVNILKNIFGSIGKLGGVVPRWFSEGLATWSESYFTAGGRLNYPLLKYEVFNFLKNANCNGLDCLDEPGEYPYASTAYWLGGAFLEDLEKKHPGTLKCLVQANSDSILFFLNSAFVECTGMSAEVAFLNYRRQQLELQNDQNKFFRQTDFKAKFGQLDLKLKDHEFINWQKGVQVIGDELFAITNYEWIDRLFRFNLNELKVISRTKFSYIFEGLTNINEEVIKSGEWPLPVVTNKYFTTTRQWRALEVDPIKNNEKPDSKFSEKVFNFPISTEFAFPLGEKTYLLLRLANRGWEVLLSNASDAKIIYQLSTNEELLRPSVFSRNGRWYLAYQSINKKKKLSYQYKIFPLPTNLTNIENNFEAKIFAVFSEAAPFLFMGRCEDQFIFKTASKKMLGAQVNFPSLSSSRRFDIGWPALWQEDLASLIVTHTNTQLTTFTSDPGVIYQYSGSCQDFIGKPDFKSKNNEAVATEAEFGAEPKENGASIKKESYSPFSYLAPQYWMIDVRGGDSESGVGAFTSLSDPFGGHIISLAGQYYTEIEKWGGTASYVYNFDPLAISALSLGAAYLKDYKKNNLIQMTDSEEMATVFSFWTFQMDRNFYVPTLSYNIGHERDISGARELKNYQLGQKFLYEKLYFDDYFQFIQLNTRHFYRENSQTDNFSGQEYLFEGRVSWAVNSVFTNIKLSYGELNKTKLGGGVLYAGGTDDVFGKNFHEFYGLSSKDAFGNQVITGRAQMDIVLANTFSGGSTFPFYMKRVDLLAGVDYLKTDVVRLEGIGTYYDQNFSSYHMGLRFDLTIGFRIPIVVDLIHSYIPNKFGEDVSQSLFFIKGNAFP